MAHLNATYEDSRVVHELAVKFWDEQAFVSDADLAKGAEMMEKIAERASQIAKDLSAVNAALVKSRG